VIRNCFVGGQYDPGVKALYAIEERRNRIIKDGAKAWLRVQGEDGMDTRAMWDQGIPQQLLDTLEGFEAAAAVAASIACLVNHGWRMQFIGSDELHSITPPINVKTVRESLEEPLYLPAVEVIRHG
jgi:hypothetical protein